MVVMDDGEEESFLDDTLFYFSVELCCAAFHFSLPCNYESELSSFGGL